jgi:hypothetical protein
MAILRIRYKYGTVTALKQWPNQTYMSKKAGLQIKPRASLVRIFSWTQTSILLSNWILTNQQTSNWNLGSDACFENTSCYFKLVTLFFRNLFRVRVPHLLLIRSSHTRYHGCSISRNRLIFFYQTKIKTTCWQSSDQSDLLSENKTWRQRKFGRNYVWKCQK